MTSETTMTAIEALTRRDMFYYEAMRFCDEHDRPHEDAELVAAAMRHRAFMEAIQPILKAKSRVVMFDMPKFIMHKDGLVETIPPELTDAQKAILAQYDELIAYSARQHGLDLSAWTPAPPP